MSRPNTVVYLLTIINKSQISYVIYNVDMTQLQNNKKITQNTTDIEMYKHFNYSNYESLNVDIALNPTEFETWIDTNNINSINTNNNYFTDNIKWLTSILFKKDNELTISNLTYVIDSYSFVNPQIISTYISDIYFIKSINVSNQYKLANTIITEIKQIKNKIDELKSGNSDALLDEKLKLFKQQTYHLSILSEILLKNNLDLSTNKDIDILTSIKPGDINIPNTVNNKLLLSYQLNKYYYTYYSYSTRFMNSCKIYTNNKNKIFPKAQKITDMLTTIYKNTSTNTSIPSNIDGIIQYLYLTPGYHYVVVIIYYLLDYILILELMNKYIKNGQIDVDKIGLSNILGHIFSMKDILSTLPDIIKLSKHQEPLKIQLLLPDENVNIIFNNSSPVSDFTIDGIEDTTFKTMYDNVQNTKYKWNDLIYMCDIIYIYSKKKHSDKIDQISQRLLSILARSINNHNNIAGNSKITKDNIDEFITDLHMNYPLTFNSSSTLSDKINYALSLSNYIYYFENRIQDIQKTHKSVYETSMDIFDEETIESDIQANIITQLTRSFNNIYALYITEGLNIDKIYTKTINSNFHKDPKIELINQLECKKTSIDVIDAYKNIQLLKSISDGNKRRKPNDYVNADIKYSNLIYIIWYFYNLLNLETTNEEPTDKIRCDLSNLLVPQKEMIKKDITYDVYNDSNFKEPYVYLKNNLIIERVNPNELYYTVDKMNGLSETLNDKCNVYVEDGNIRYVYTDILLNPTNIFQLHTILSNDDILKSFGIENKSSENKNYIQLKIDSHLTDTSKKIQCETNYNKIKNQANILTNNLRNDVTGLINKYSNKSTQKSSGGGENAKTQKNKSEKIKVFLDTNLPKITKFILYINKFSQNIKPDNRNLYNLTNQALHIFIPFQKLMNKMKHNIYELKHIRFIDFYNTNILHPSNIMNHIYDVCKMIITDIYFIDKLYNKLSQIHKSDMFKEIKNMTSGSYTKKYNNNKIDLLIK